jgi:hypothetical protein
VLPQRKSLRFEQAGGREALQSTRELLRAIDGAIAPDPDGSRRVRLRIFPTGVLGSAAMNWMRLGTLNGASFDFANAISSSSLAVPEDVGSKALG